MSTRKTSDQVYIRQEEGCSRECARFAKYPLGEISDKRNVVDPNVQHHLPPNLISMMSFKKVLSYPPNTSNELKDKESSNNNIKKHSIYDSKEVRRT